jgi:cytochrome b subunit of formate dehydrogenase
MVEIVHRDGLTDPGRRRDPARQEETGATDRRRPEQPPRSDVGTIILHWTTAIALIVCLFTGLRVATFGHVAPGFAQALSPILPQGEMWTWHFFADLTLFFSASAYLVYIYRAGLSPRNALKKIKIVLMPAARKMRWDAVNIGLHWIAYVLIVMMTVTGVLLYLGHGGWWVWVHSVSALVALGYIFVHVLAHYLYGGWWQLFRLFRPAQLMVTRVMRPYPLLIATGVGVATVALAAGIDWTSRDTLVVVRVNTAPKIDGVLDDAVWAMARPVTIRTQQGANLGGTGESMVEARAVHDGTNIYFAFRWEDPSRSMRRVPLVKKEDGWHMLATRSDVADVADFYEDKFAIGFSRSPHLRIRREHLYGHGPAARVTQATARPRLSLRGGGQSHGCLAVEGLARRPSWPCRRSVFRHAARADPGRSGGQGPLSGRLPERSRPGFLLL